MVAVADSLVQDVHNWRAVGSEDSRARNIGILYNLNQRPEGDVFWSESEREMRMRSPSALTVSTVRFKFQPFRLTEGGKGLGQKGQTKSRDRQ